MYEKFFGLDELPFDGLPDSRFYFVGNCQHEALEILTNNLSRNGAICVLSGPSGSGKTTLVRMLIRSLPKKMRIIAIDDPRLDEHMLLATILRASGVVATSFESIAELTLKLRRFLERSVQSGIVTTVILDEAQGLADEVIEQIRLISNIEGDLGKMINFLLVGQEDLIENIQKPMHKMFWGRVKAFATLKSLKRDEVHAYINFRMQTAGCHEPIFTTNAINALYKESKGLPRIINSVADRALCIAFEAQKKNVSGHIVKKAFEVVRHKRSLFTLGLKNFSKYIALQLFVKLPVILLGMAICIGTFMVTCKLAPSNLNSFVVQNMVRHDAVVSEEYAKAMAAMLPGRESRNRDLALFDKSIKESVFKSDAVATLIKLWGYERADGSKAECGDLSGIKLKCTELDTDLEALKLVNRPAVLTLRNEDLTPFFAVVKSYNDTESSIILGNRLYRVKTSYLEHVYDGQMLFIGSSFGSDSKLEDKLALESFNKELKRICSLKHIEECATAEDRKEIQKLYLEYRDGENENMAYSLIDNALNTGLYLEHK